MTDVPSISITHRGRTGTIRYTDPAGHFYNFECELGGGAALLLIYAPTTEAWSDSLPWAQGRRQSLLAELARHVIAVESPDAHFVVHERGVDILQPPQTAVVGTAELLR